MKTLDYLIARGFARVILSSLGDQTMICAACQKRADNLKVSDNLEVRESLGRRRYFAD